MSSSKTIKLADKLNLTSDFMLTHTKIHYLEPIFIGCPKRVRFILDVHGVGIQDWTNAKYTDVSLELDGAIDSNENTSYFTLTLGSGSDPIPLTEDDAARNVYTRSVSNGDKIMPWLRVGIKFRRIGYAGAPFGTGTVIASVTVIIEE